MSTTIHWPGMRTEYAWLPPHEGSTTTKPHQIGVSFTQHAGLVGESAGRNVRSDVAAGAVFVTGSHGITWTRVAETTEALEIYPDAALLGRAARRAGDPDIAPAFGVRDGTVFGLASVLKRAHVAGGTLSDIEASTVAHRLAEHLVETYREGGPTGARRPAGTLDRGLVDRIAQYVDADLGGRITLDRLAAVAALSPYHFARACGGSPVVALNACCRGSCAADSSRRPVTNRCRSGWCRPTRRVTTGPGCSPSRGHGGTTDGTGPGEQQERTLRSGPPHAIVAR